MNQCDANLLNHWCLPLSIGIILALTEKFIEESHTCLDWLTPALTHGAAEALNMKPERNRAVA